METTVAYAPKILSGIDVLDQAWGGVYRGGSYLVYGRAASGRGVLTLLFTQTGVLLGDRCLFISPERPKDLMIQAASMDFDLRQAYESGLVRLIRIPPMLDTQHAGDEAIARAMQDLVSIVRQHRPSRLVLNDFVPFVQFKSFDRFRTAFVQMLEQIDLLDTTMMLVMAEPANEQSRQVIEFMRSQMTGSIHVELIEEDPNSTQRRLTLVPNIGHLRRRVVEYWDLTSVVEQHEAAAVTGVRMLPATATSPVDAPRAPQPVRLRPSHTSSPTPSPDAYVSTPSQPLRPIPLGRNARYTPPATPSGTRYQTISIPLGQRSQAAPPPAPALSTARPSPGVRQVNRAYEAPSRSAAFSEPRDESPAPSESVHADSFAAAPPSIPADEKPEPAYVPPSDSTFLWSTELNTAPFPQTQRPTQRFVFEVPTPSAPHSQGEEPRRDREPAWEEQRTAQAGPSIPPLHGRYAADASKPGFPPQEPAFAANQPWDAVPEPERVSHTDRDAFRDRLQQHFLHRDVNETPFLLIAMRMDRSENRTTRPFDFEFILDLVGELLRLQDDMFVDLERERMIVLLANTRPDEAQRFFARLKNRLREEAPQQADQLLHSVSAIVVPDGRPFQNAEEFLSYALDEA